ncbi:MAG TPA: hypothetical protein VFO41_10085, partial [Alphaproteobacteria bacterium]|nr:hypothetical protein [Alphaproteobacteria bacterium]
LSILVAWGTGTARPGWFSPHSLRLASGQVNEPPAALQQSAAPAASERLAMLRGFRTKVLSKPAARHVRRVPWPMQVHGDGEDIRQDVQQAQGHDTASMTGDGSRTLRLGKSADKRRYLPHCVT